MAALAILATTTTLMAHHILLITAITAQSHIMKKRQMSRPIKTYPLSQKVSPDHKANKVSSF